MGYSITIGELQVDKYPEDGIESDCISFSAKGVSHESAPAFGEPTDFTNSRWPSYSAWSNFLEYAGLYDAFFCNRRLIGGRPGVRLVTKEMLELIQESKLRMESENPPPVATMENYTEKNGYYCRIIWLEYWCKWALENCETPVIANS